MLSYSVIPNDPIVNRYLVTCDMSSDMSKGRVRKAIGMPLRNDDVFETAKADAI